MNLQKSLSTAPVVVPIVLLVIQRLFEDYIGHWLGSRPWWPSVNAILFWSLLAFLWGYTFRDIFDARSWLRRKWADLTKVCDVTSVALFVSPPVNEFSEFAKFQVSLAPTHNLKDARIIVRASSYTLVDNKTTDRTLPELTVNLRAGMDPIPVTLGYAAAHTNDVIKEYGHPEHLFWIPRRSESVVDLIITDKFGIRRQRERFTIQWRAIEVLRDWMDFRWDREDAFKILHH